MKFDKAREVEQLFYDMRLADFPRGQNRARINDLFNGVPPYTDEEVNRDGIAINVNSLEGTRISHDARSQFYSAFLKPGNYFTATTDMGPKHKRSMRGGVVTRQMNKLMKHSLDYFECFRSKFASLVLHGVGPAAWRDHDCWLPDPVGIEDVLIPSNTLITMRNLPFFFVYRSFTAPELIKLTRGPKVDKGWNMKVVNNCLEWAAKETMAMSGANWTDIWSPEKIAELVKGDGGFYAADRVPTIDCADFYFWSDEGKNSGWRRRIILDAWGAPQSNGGQVTMSRDPKKDFSNDTFLYDGGTRKYADERSELISFQFADLSAVSPFRYHSVRSLGFLLFSVCHLQNRMRCRFNESVFEALCQYFRVKSMDEVQRVLKVQLSNRAFVDDSLQFIPATERWQVDKDLVEYGLMSNQQLITENSSSYVQNQNFSKDRVEKTKFQVMAEVNAMTSLVSAGLLQAYSYQNAEYREIFRRFMKKGSNDPDVIKFRAAVLKRGVPEEMLVPEAWEIEPDRIMGAGNKTLEMAIAQQLMEYRNLYDPEAQRHILRDVTLAITDDPARAELLVPEQPKISDSVHDAQLAAGTLMQGLPVAVKDGINQIEYVEALMASMAVVIQKGQSTGMVSPDTLIGLQNLAQHIAQHIQLIAQDPNEKARVKQYGDQLGQMMNLVKAFQQRLAEQMQSQNGNGGPDQETQSKIANDKLMAQAKMANTRESHAQKTAQRQIQFEQEQVQDAQRFKLELELAKAEHALEIQKMQAEHQLELQRMQVEAQQNMKIKEAEAEMKMKLAEKQAQNEPSHDSD